MAKKPNESDKHDRQHLRNLSTYQLRIDRIYQEVIREAARIGASVGEIKPDTAFSFADYPTIRKRVEKLMSGLKSRLTVSIVNGIDTEWTLANNKNSELARRVFGDNASKLSPAQQRRYFSTNDNARQAFQQRKVNGLNLSERVWRYTDQFKEEIEMGLDLGIRNGLSAQEMAHDLRDYLRHPDKLFRRVRDEHGILHLSKRAAAYHPGRGVYRSSYMNARRLAATEANIAYRTSDHLRWQQMDFVVGIEIRLSDNHTCKGSDGKPHPFYDICDKLAGRYPKDFKFTGWHPHCRCRAISILKTQEEIAEDTRKILNGEKPDGESVNRVDDVPQEFKDWIADNADRAARSMSMPYFIKDNMQYVPREFAEIYGSRVPFDSYAEYEAAMRYNKAHANFTPVIRKNNTELSKLLPVIQGKIMNVTEADGGRCNPNFTLPDAKDKGYMHNCQTCTMSYELRRRGFDIEAMPNPVRQGYKKMREIDKFYNDNGVRWDDRYLNSDGKRAVYSWSRTANITSTDSAKLAFINGQTAAQGRYEVYCAWQNKDEGAHVFIVERTKDGDLLWYDPQTGRRGGTFDDYLSRMRHDGIGVLRIDDKVINPKFASRFAKRKR